MPELKLIHSSFVERMRKTRIYVTIDEHGRANITCTQFSHPEHAITVKRGEALLIDIAPGEQCVFLDFTLEQP